MQRILLPSLFGLVLACGTAHAAPAADPSAPSQASANLSAVAVDGSLLTLAAAGQVVVASVRTTGQVLEIVLAGTADASRATVRLSGKAAGGLSLATGTVLEVVAASTGQLLVMSGKVIAFFPNEAGKALLHHARAS
jgi:hypothetical protein